MDTKYRNLLLEWAKPFIRDQDLSVVFYGEETRRYDAVKYAMKKGVLIQMRRGLYLIGKPFGKGSCDPFEMAAVLYGPSYISLESALSFHGWIPEAVFTTTSVTPKRAKVIDTPVGVFRYSHTPTAHFYLNVQRIEQATGEKSDTCFLLAEPWKAVADALYCYRKPWRSVRDLSLDLRIEIETLEQSDKKSLWHVAEHYASKRVQKVLRTFFRELS